MDLGTFTLGLTKVALSQAPKVQSRITRGRRAKQSNLAAKSLQQAAVSTGRFRVALAGALTEADLDGSEADALTNFLNSHEGRYATSLITAQAIWGTGDLTGVDGTVAALLSLHRRSQGNHDKEMARLLVIEVATLVRQSYRELQSSDPAAASELKQECRHALSAFNRGKSDVVGHQNSRISQLAQALPDNHDEEAANYLARVCEATKELMVQTLADPLRVKIDDYFILPQVTRLDQSGESDRELVGRHLLEGENDLRVTIGRFRRVALLGDPGAGKSTAGQYLVHKLSSSVKPSIVPFLVTLRHYAKALSLDPQLGILKFIERQAQEDLHADLSLPTLRYLLHVGRACVIFDGLDEILDLDTRATVAKRIGAFADGFPACTFMVTARFEGYEESAVSKFIPFLVQPFNKSRTLKYVRNFMSVRGQRVVVMGSDRDFWTKSNDIRDLRSSPLLLGVLCALYCSGRSLPNSRAELYEKCADMLFEEWDASKGIAVSVAEKSLTHEAVTELALRVFQGGSEEFAESWARELLADVHIRDHGSKFLEAQAFAKRALALWRGRAWVLVYVGERDGETYYRFSHRSFMEYFAAQYLVQSTDLGGDLDMALGEYLDTRTAVSFSLLSISLFNKKSKTQLDAFYKKAAAGVQKDLDEGQPLAAYYRSRTLLDSLLLTRSPWIGGREEVVTAAIETFMRAVPSSPILPLSDAVHVPPFYSHDVFRAKTIEEPEVNIRQLCSLIVFLGLLTDAESRNSLDRLQTLVLRALESDPSLALRVSTCLDHMTYLDDVYANRELRVRLRETASNVLARPLSRDSIIEDAWGGLHHARVSKQPWNSALRRLGLQALFIDDWPFSADRDHYVQAPLLHVTRAFVTGEHELDNVWFDEFSLWIFAETEARLDWWTSFVEPVQGELRQMRGTLSNLIWREIPPGLQRWTAVQLLSCIRTLDPGSFARYFKFADRTEFGKGVVEFMTFLSKARSWDGKDPDLAFLELQAADLDRVERSVERYLLKRL